MAPMQSLEALAEAAGLDSSCLPDLDLAFEISPDLPAALLQQTGELVDPAAGVERWHTLFTLWLAELCFELPRHLDASSYCLGLTLVDDATIAKLNSDWREMEGPTDVLAFAAQDAAADGRSFPRPPQPGEAGSAADSGLELGDIVISLETAANQATEQSNSLPRELLFLASHGLLHLLGWDHPDDDQLAAMLERQDRLLQVALLAGLA
jgi:probable rRNA maturation factor